MYMSLFLESKIQPIKRDMTLPPPLPPMNVTLIDRPENDMNMEGESWGVGMNAAVHVRFNEQWSAGLTYRSQVTHNVNGRVKFHNQYMAPRRVPESGLPPIPFGVGTSESPQTPALSFINSGFSATAQLPDSAALAVMWKPLPTLSVEAGTIWTRWSTFNALNFYTNAGMRSINDKGFRDGWNFNASVEYSPLDWLTLRLGYWHETPVINETYADYLLPTYGRDCLTTGVGFKWKKWTLDLAYAHLWIYPLSYDRAAAMSSTWPGTRTPNVLPGTSKNAHADMFSVSLGYSF
jgi:long-chain fatty acid transport protein